MVVLNFVFNPDAEEVVPKSEEEHRHSGERNGCSLEREGAGHRVGKQVPRQRGRECRGWDGLGRLNPAIGKEGMHRAKKQRAYVVKFLFFFMVWLPLLCSLVPGTLAFYLLYLDDLRLFGLLCFTVCDHIICISRTQNQYGHRVY